jgi:hypothetical protein
MPVSPLASGASAAAPFRDSTAGLPRIPGRLLDAWPQSPEPATRLSRSAGAAGTGRAGPGADRGARREPPLPGAHQSHGADAVAPVLLLDQFGQGGEGQWGVVLAAGVIATVPMLVICFLGQRSFVEGIATTGRKG